MKQIKRYLITWYVSRKHMSTDNLYGYKHYIYRTQHEFCFVDAFTKKAALEYFNAHSPCRKSLYQPTRHAFHFKCALVSDEEMRVRINEFNNGVYDTMKRIALLLGEKPEEIDYISKEK